MEEREPSILRLPDERAGLDDAVRPATVLGPPPPPQATTRRPAVRDEAPTVYVAGFWRRAVGGLVDTVVVLPLALAAVWLASKLTGLTLPPLRRGAVDYWLDLVLAGDPGLLGALGLGATVLVIYLLVFQALAGRTLGMRSVGLKIIDVYGDAPGVFRCGLRAVGYLVAAATGGLGFLWIGFDREKRGLHDWLAGTYVTKPPPRGARDQS
jgi:uncharacterized RDD family membrane protein YckC